MQSSTTNQAQEELKVALYERKYDSANAVSVSSLQHLREYARRNHLVVVGVYIDTINKKRCAYSRLIKSIEKGKVNAILCRGMHGISRKFAQLAPLMRLLSSGSLKSIRTPEQELVPPTDRDLDRPERR